MTYSAGVQLDNKTGLELVSGKITYYNGDISYETLDYLFDSSTRTRSTRRTTLSGTFHLGQTHREGGIEFDQGDKPIRFELTFSNGDSFTFICPVREVLEEIDVPQWGAVDFASGSTPPKRALGVQRWTRHDKGITGQYPNGLITFTLLDRTRTARWMQSMRKPQTTPLNELTLPGTHDSGTWTMGSTSKCQSMPLREQLDLGIRFIDIRLEPVPDLPSGKIKLLVYHGLSSSTLDFEKYVIPTCLGFLDDNPGETILMLVNRNSLPKIISDAAFEAAANRALNNSRILRGPNMPTLDHARGSIVLAARHPNIGGIALDQGWPEDECGTLTTGTGAGALTVEIQDVYKFDPLDKPQTNINEKWGFVKDYLTKAQASSAQGKWFINYTSATALGSMNPLNMAEGVPGVSGMNILVFLFLNRLPKGHFGTVPMDFPEIPQYGKLIEKLIDSNA